MCAILISGDFIPASTLEHSYSRTFNPVSRLKFVWPFVEASLTVNAFVDSFWSAGVLSVLNSLIVRKRSL